MNFLIPKIKVLVNFYILNIVAHYLHAKHMCMCISFLFMQRFGSKYFEA